MDLDYEGDVVHQGILTAGPDLWISTVRCFRLVDEVSSTRKQKTNIQPKSDTAGEFLYLFTFGTDQTTSDLQIN